MGHTTQDTKQGKTVKYASIDLETTGLDYNRDQILEVGIVIDDLSWPDVVKEGPYG